jgi:hypothetical protein
MYRNRELTTGFIDECAAGFEWIVLWPRGNDGRWLVESRHREQLNAEKMVRDPSHVPNIQSARELLAPVAA